MKTYLAIRLKDKKQVANYFSINESPPPEHYTKYEDKGKPIKLTAVEQDDTTFFETERIVYVKQQIAILDCRYDFFIDERIKLEDLEFEANEILNLMPQN
jgi:hypothetical protein